LEQCLYNKLSLHLVLSLSLLVLQQYLLFVLLQVAVVVLMTQQKQVAVVVAGVYQWALHLLQQLLLLALVEAVE
jgi:hypothetical protein